MLQKNVDAQKKRYRKVCTSEHWVYDALLGNIAASLHLHAIYNDKTRIVFLEAPKIVFCQSVF